MLLTINNLVQQDIAFVKDRRFSCITITALVVIDVITCTLSRISEIACLIGLWRVQVHYYINTQRRGWGIHYIFIA